MSWFKNSGSKNIFFPETHKFPKESYMWEYRRLELDRRMDVAQLREEFRSGQPEGELLNVLGRLAGRPVSQTEVDTWRVSSRDSMADFVAKLNDLPR